MKQWKRLQNSTQGSVAKDVGYSQSVVSKIWCKYKEIRWLRKVKHTSRPWKTSKYQNRKFKAIGHENRKQKMKKKGSKQKPMFVIELRNQLNEVVFT